MIISFSFAKVCKVSAQEKININTGFGIPEFIYLGVSYQLDQYQIGFNVGALPVGSSESLMSFSADMRYHFAGLSEFSNRRPWYVRIGLNYLRDETDYVIEKYLYLNTRIGRDFNISKKIGIAVDIGTVFQLHNTEIIKNPSDGWYLDLDFPVLPSFGIGLFYRI